MGITGSATTKDIFETLHREFGISNVEEFEKEYQKFSGIDIGLLTGGKPHET